MWARAAINNAVAEMASDSDSRLASQYVTRAVNPEREDDGSDAVADAPVLHQACQRPGQHQKGNRRHDGLEHRQAAIPEDVECQRNGPRASSVAEQRHTVPIARRIRMLEDRRGERDRQSRRHVYARRDQERRPPSHDRKRTSRPPPRRPSSSPQTFAQQGRTTIHAAGAVCTLRPRGTLGRPGRTSTPWHERVTFHRL